MNVKRIFFPILIFLSGCSKPSETIIVATAANVQYVMKELKTEFEKESGKKIEIVVSSSGKLTAQIREGAPFDVFVSADTKYPEEIFKKGDSDEKPKIYAYGTLALWSLSIPENELNIKVLNTDKVKKIAVPNPKMAPYGEAAEQALQKENLLEPLKSKIVYGESIAQAAQYITTGSVEAGFTALSVILAPEMKGKGHYTIIDSTSYKPIAQAVLLLRHSENSPKKETSQKFYNFLFSQKAKAIFKKYGYK
ncbi:molybdate ABC transporter substrate-binding protein [Dyadobacter frigoris]|uniref:Molybdate ABC transporter substrate-binding protein n=1 Tax=Dyadobacter frigoris TaxID=2576211 RepID=A0A4U6CSH2_9BACT|nr:molybdate ABC transporter substrate-binding protein [Dyadobacter frigoris]TKT86625.1 molybdate ABC transporter substrate-binding protein [Dyadobacter frigoris]GLU56825.1 molybdate ABC transporter substrate-binding protein [Dyadobacter frigoris]